MQERFQAKNIDVVEAERARIARGEPEKRMIERKERRISSYDVAVEQRKEPLVKGKTVRTMDKLIKRDSNERGSFSFKRKEEKPLRDASNEASTAVRELIFPIEHELRKMNDPEKPNKTAGDQIADKFLKSRLLGEHYAGKEEVVVQKTLKTNNITDEEFGVPIERNGRTQVKRGNIVDVLEGRANPMNERVGIAAKDIKNLLNRIAYQASAKDVHLRRWNPITKSYDYLPFVKRKDYFPHVYTREFWKNIKGDAKFKANIIERIAKTQDIPLDEAAKVLDIGRRYGEKMAAAQNSREYNIPGYERSTASLYKYVREMGERIASAEVLGPKDLAGPEIDSLVRQTSDPDYAFKLLERVTQREEPFMPGQTKAVDALRTAAGWLYLSRAGISNLAQTTRIPARAGLKATAKAFAERIRDKQGFYDDALSGGAITEIGTKGLLEDFGSKSNVFKVTGLEHGERFMRSIAHWAGKSEANALLESIKKQPENQGLKNKLSDLLLDRDLDHIIKRGKLNEKELAVAGGRMAELTQGRADPIDLPRAWTGSPFANLFFLYKKYALRDTVSVWRAIKSNPARAIPILAALNQVAGESIGDIKELIREAGLKIAGADVEFGERVAGRGEKRAKSIEKTTGIEVDPVIGRFIDNYLQAWVLGIVPDIIDQVSQGDFAGTLPSMAGEITKAGAETAHKLATGKEEPFKPIGKELVEKVPLIGPGLREGLFPAKTKKTVGPPRPSTSRQVHAPSSVNR